MLYAALKAIHLLSLIAWLGGMFYTLACLRPALAVLDAPSRPRLMGEVLRRFLAVVDVAVGLMVVSGLSMLYLAWRAAAGPGLSFNMPLDWYVMIVLGVLMFAIYGHVRAGPFRQLQRALGSNDASASAAALGQTRKWVTVNLVLGAIVVVVMKLGAAT
jgi:uncharacterized membrane protein